MSTPQRSNEVDIIRMSALIGICVVNVPFMALPVESVFSPPDGFYDKLAAFLVECFFQLKFFLLFSFIFGWGFSIQSQSAALKGYSFSRFYFHRMAGLAILGIAHAILVFSGDILLLYAALGVLLWRIKDFSPRQLLSFSAWMVLLSMVCLTVLALLIDIVITESADSLVAGNDLTLGGSFIEATQLRLMDWPITFLILVLLQGPLAMGAFAAGLAAAKTDFFSKNSEGLKLIRKYLVILLMIALPINGLYAAVMGGIVPESYELLSLVGFVFIAIGAPALSLVYLYFFIRLARVIKIPHLLILAGRNSLSSYVAQGVVAGLVFGAYGLGLFHVFGHGMLILVALVIALVAMISVGVFAHFLGRGPLEFVLRRMSNVNK